jgi:hypothetical protein
MRPWIRNLVTDLKNGRAGGLLCACILAPMPAAMAHETPNLEHTHAFKQTGYGTWRQGHSVNGPQGSIIIWSPRSYSGYEKAPDLRFARPEPITRAPGSAFARPKDNRTPERARSYQE